MLIFRQDFRSCHCESLDDQLRAIYSAALGMGVARGYYGAAYPAGECVDVLCPAGCTARRASRGEKGGSCRKWPGFLRKNTSWRFLMPRIFFLFVRVCFSSYSHAEDSVQDAQVQTLVAFNGLWSTTLIMNHCSWQQQQQQHRTILFVCSGH